VTCHQAEELILESIDNPLDPAQRRALDQHIGECGACRQFQRSQLALDVSLASHFSAATLGLEFDEALRQRIAAERRRVLWEDLPDLLHLGGGLAVSLVCGWLLPFSFGMVIAAGLGLTLVAYLFQVLLRSFIEEL